MSKEKDEKSIVDTEEDKDDDVDDDGVDDDDDVVVVVVVVDVDVVGEGEEKLTLEIESAHEIIKVEEDECCCCCSSCETGSSSSFNADEVFSRDASLDDVEFESRSIARSLCCCCGRSQNVPEVGCADVVATSVEKIVSRCWCWLAVSSAVSSVDSSWRRAALQYTLTASADGSGPEKSVWLGRLPRDARSARVCWAEPSTVVLLRSLLVATMLQTSRIGYIHGCLRSLLVATILIASTS